MSDITKLSFKIGQVEFSGEGSESWLEKQLDKLLEKTSKIVGAQKDIKQGLDKTEGKGFSIGSTTLAAFLGEKNAKSNQNRKFLATAAYLQLKGNKSLKTSDVSKALVDSHQTRLGNPSDTLSQNISKGFCDKNGEGFYVTDAGYVELGIES